MDEEISQRYEKTFINKDKKLASLVEEEEDLDSSNANFALEGENSPKEGITPGDDSKKSILGVLGGLDEEPKEDENIN
jgi:hypothetical protein